MGITLNFFPGGKTRAVTLSYDDGRVQDRRLVGILNRFGVKGTFHIISEDLSRVNCVGMDELSTLYQGHEIALHTHTHPSMAFIPPEAQVEEILQNRRCLELCTGRVIYGLSYPNGSFNLELMRRLSALGVAYARTVQANGGFSLPEDFMCWHPTCHHSRGLQRWSKEIEHSHTDLAERLDVFLDMPLLGDLPVFYLWGHSYEFDRDDTWDVIEGFCQRVSRAGDVWCATNQEIYRYVTALKQLRFSADCTLVENPSAQGVCVGVDGKAVSVPGGTTMRLM